MEVSGLMALMKPPLFVLTKKGDPEHMMQEFIEYVKIFGMFKQATGWLETLLRIMMSVEHARKPRQH